MVKRIIIFPFLFWVFYINAQNNCQGTIDIDYVINLTPSQRVNYLDNLVLCNGNSDNQIKDKYARYWLFKKYTNNGFLNGYNIEEYYFRKYYKDSDNDGFPDNLNDYVYFYNATIKGNLFFYGGQTPNATDSQFLLGKHNYNKLNQNSTVTSIESSYNTYYYNGNYWVTNYYGMDDNPQLASTPSYIQAVYNDSDNDGYGYQYSSLHYYKEVSNTPSTWLSTLYYDVNFVTNNFDCNDNNQSVGTNAINWYRDSDEDGYGNPNITQVSCSQPLGYVDNSNDCNDNDPKYNNQNIVWYADFDGDGFGDKNNTLISSCPPTDYVTDCYFDDCPNQKGERGNGCPITAFNFDNDNKNYTYERGYSFGYDVDNLNLATQNETREVISYKDDFGRNKQDILLRAGGVSQNSIVKHYEYQDNSTRLKEYLPYSSTNINGVFENNSKSNTLNFYNTKKYENTLNPYSEKVYESSPLNRVKKQSGPGNDWLINQNSDNDHSVKFIYKTNISSDYVKNYSVSFTNNNIFDPELVDNGIYEINKLRKVIVKNENWLPSQQYADDNTIQSFTDAKGNLILKREFEKGLWQDTYYVYDVFGNLTYVLPPKVRTSAYIVQQEWAGKSFWKEVPELFSDVDYSEIDFYFSPTGFLSIYIWAEGDEIYLEDESLSLDFISSTSKLPYIDLGEMEDQETGLIFGDAEINSNGKFEIASRGTVNELGYAEFEIFINLSSYQNTFNPPPVSELRLDELAYQYKYDNKNRIIEKKVPGKDWEYIIYDPYDRPVLTQDGKQRLTNKWSFIKYDKFGRIAFSGIHTHATSKTQQQMQNHYNTVPAQSGSKLYYETRSSSEFGSSYIQHHYTNFMFPYQSGTIDILKVNYYDDYIFNRAGFSNTINTSYNLTSTIHVKGLFTGSKVKVLDNSNNWTTTVNYYNDKGRLIHSNSKNSLLQVTDLVELKLDFEGKPTKVIKTHKKTGKTDVVKTNNFVYDHMGRILSNKQIINQNSEELLSKATYDELGRMITKDIGNTESNPLQTIDYQYNIRGWLTNINDPTSLEQSNDLFGININYNSTKGPNSGWTDSNYNLFNGNISHIMWKTNNLKSSLKHYSFKYDALNRFKSGYYAENQSINNKFSEYVYEYDSNGNILRLGRNMENPSNPNYSTSIDYLTYDYNGNILKGIRDSRGLSTTGSEGFKDTNSSGDDFQYDINGNLISDANKGIASINYNNLNLPEEINFNSAADKISFTYDANGTKLRKTITINGTPQTIDYADEFVYNNNNLTYISHQEGYIDYVNGLFSYAYQYKDHLGNVRLTYKDSNGDGDVKGYSSEIFYDDMENSAGWDSVGAIHGGSATTGTEYSLSGNNAVKITNANSNEYKYAHSNTWIPINNSSSTEYIFSGWFYSTGPGARLLLFMNENNETNYYTLASNSDISRYVTGKWIYLEKKVTVPSNIDKLNLRVDTFGGSAGTVWFDNMSIRKVNDASIVEIIEEHNYYPFGLKHKDFNPSTNSNELAKKVKFNGKEFEQSLGINLYEMDWRSYDPTIGRWTSIDPVTHFSLSPYNAFDNNPVFWSDPSGADSEYYQDPDRKGDYEGEEWNDEDGNFIWDGQSWHWDMARGYGLPEMFLHNQSGWHDEYDPWRDENGNLLDLDEINWSLAYEEDINRIVSRIHRGTNQAARLITEIASYAIPTGVVSGLVVKGIRIAGTKIASKIASNQLMKNGSKILINSTKQLQRKWDKAKIFGIKGTPTKPNLAKFSEALNKHINNPNVKIINGSYQGEPAIHYLNTKTGLNVITHPNGSFWSGWKLGEKQYMNVITRGSL